MFTTAGLTFGGSAAAPESWPSELLLTLPAPSAAMAVPCAARPSTRFVHRDGPCRCFVGGPAPEFPPSAGTPLPAAS
ncbi:hypothetical protein [Actinotalea sp. Marseille-Q4924]|uniref:hypothetical protein n=1 Tax=Actinotalea sp. Marseille-Q4924 TaxID=2866571 RepID=UPI001CE489E2|nr:hypothetical protein [Actinotalea sp. Marseille-Q4924]